MSIVLTSNCIEPKNSLLMLIYVVAPSGRTTEVSIRPTDTVGNLKIRIEDEEWIRQGTMIEFHYTVTQAVVTWDIFYRLHVQIGNV
jgi:hypothetical protein